MRSPVACLFVFLFVVLAPATALSQQLVTFDQVVTITQQGNGAGAYHFLIRPAASEPASWTTPVDYSKGTAHVYMNVMEKPSKRNTTMTICFDGNLEGYGCITTPGYTDVGVHESKMSLPTATWQYDKIAWNRRRQEYHLVVKDPALGGTPGGRPATDFVPTKMRIVMTVVPPGGTYVPPMGTGSPGADGGAAPDGASAGDGPPSGTGGTGGSGNTGTGGSSGTGGSMTTGGSSGGSMATGGSSGGGGAGSGGSGTSTGGSGGGGSGNAGSGGSGSGGSGGNGGSSTRPNPPNNPPPMTPAGGGKASGGCSVTPSGASPQGLMLLAAALAPGLLRRWRRQKYRDSPQTADRHSP